jgi:hypothetical protein
MRAVLLAFLLLSAPARAEEPIPACNAAREGATACLAGKLCSCGIARGGSITTRASGYRWDCGVLRPSCGPAVPPADVDGRFGGVPGMMLEMPMRPRW